MSQLVTVKIKEGEFVNRECLEKALNEIGMNFISIEQNELGLYTISLSQGKVRNGQVSAVTKELTDSAKSIVLKVTPVYVRLFTILELENKGFKEKTRMKIPDGEKIVMHRSKSLSDGGGYEIIEITIHSDQTITLDHHNFKGKSCQQVSDKLIKQLGKIQSREMKPEAQVSVIRRENQSNTRLRI
ncbi:MAG: DUF2997 domain-containing protein [Candidatus Heimdallarchaeota archaeon]|nr:DUF2997 domain-containing protein [Candidatus Heimdallarchaeota archaeon]